MNRTLIRDMATAVLASTVLFGCFGMLGTYELDASIATSPSFTVRHGIVQTGGGNSTYSYSTSTTFKSAGALGQTAIGTSTSATYSLKAGLLQTIATSSSGGASLTFSVDSGTKAFGTITPGILAVATSSFTVTTSNSTGFSVSVARVNSLGTMLLNTDSSKFIPDKTAWSAPGNTSTAGNSTASTTQPSTLQFRIRQSGTDSGSYASAWWGTDDTVTNALFAGFPTTAQKIVNRSTAAAGGATSIVLYNINAPVTQVNGTYTGDITYTAVANP